MYLTISKRFEISTSRRLWKPDWSADKNVAVYGPESTAKYGTGRNYVAIFVFHGPVDENNGMMINVTDIKQHINDLLARRYDHRFLNADTKPFDEIPPTPENVANQLLEDAIPLFEKYSAHPVVCHLIESPKREATAYNDGTTEAHHWLTFSAARQTMSPHLSDEENQELFGIAASPEGHGHNYRLRISLAGRLDEETGMLVPPDKISESLRDLHKELDHRNLNHEVPGLEGWPITTESLSRYMYGRLADSLPVDRVRLFELDEFFAECNLEDKVFLGMERAFSSSHRLHSPKLTNIENKEIYEKCNNPAGHGHTYRVEATIGGEYDERSGTLYDFVKFREGLDAAVEPWQNKHLDWETDDFREQPSTSENIIQVLWPRLNGQLDDRLRRLRLWETPNNRFTLRRISD